MAEGRGVNIVGDGRSLCGVNSGCCAYTSEIRVHPRLLLKPWANDTYPQVVAGLFVAEATNGMSFSCCEDAISVEAYSNSSVYCQCLEGELELES